MILPKLGEIYILGSLLSNPTYHYIDKPIDIPFKSIPGTFYIPLCPVIL